MVAGQAQWGFVLPDPPEVPTGKELEDYVAGLFQSTQHYVEKNVCETDVLELDVMATSFASGQPDPHLIEVKGGQWGFSDLFKVVGWMHYLSIPKGLFITTRGPEDKPVEFYSERVGRKGLRVLVIGDVANARRTFGTAGFGTVDEGAHDLWRYSFWTERRNHRSPEGRDARAARRHRAA